MTFGLEREPDSYHKRLKKAFEAEGLGGSSLSILWDRTIEVMPEKYMFGRRPPVPLWNKDIKIVVGEPIEFDIAKLKQTAISASRNSSSFSNEGWPPLGPLDEAAQKCLYIDISERIRSVMEKLRVISNNPKV